MDKKDSPDKVYDARLAVVLGMHRSGTSAITRAMQTMGAEFGSRLMPAVAGVNDKGFFEDIDVNAINIEAMAAAGMDWHTMAPIELDAISPERLDRLQTKAIALLRERCTARTFVLKDPRISRLLPFWQSVFACLDARVVYVIAVRNPISVVQSLATRNDFAEEKSYLLWLAHTVPALVMTRDSVRSIVDYDRLMDSPHSVLTQIATQLDLPLDQQAVDEFGKEFLDEQLRHTQFKSRDLNLIRSAPRQVKELFAALEVASRDGRETPELDLSIHNAQKYLEDVAPLLRYEWRLQQRVWQLGDSIAANIRQKEELSNVLFDAQQSAENNALRIEQLGSESLSYQSTIKSQEETIRSQLELAAAQRAELTHSVSMVEQIMNSTSWRITAPIRAMRRCFGRKR